MALEIIMARPPNFDKIVKVFPDARKSGTVFSWGGCIFSPDTQFLSPQLRAHEAVHCDRQRQFKGVAGLEAKILAWWGKYLVDPQFRLDEEIPAHRMEYRTFININRDRRIHEPFLKLVATRLSSKLYGELVTLQEARHLIVK